MSRTGRRGIVHLFLLAGAVLMLLPFIWMLSTSLKNPVEALQFPPTWLPQAPRFANYVEAWRAVPFPRYFFNTVLVTVAVLTGTLISSCLAAYAFARMEFRGREVLFFGFLAVMMVPMPVYLVPSYLIMSKLGWIDTYLALIVPWTASVFTIFLLRQHFRAIPRELYEAAVIDGCSRLGFLWRVVLPLSRAVLVTVALFSIIGSWNSFMWPLVMVNSKLLRPIQVGLAYFAQGEATEYTLLMAASTFCIAPLVLLFFVAQRQIIESYAKTGLKE
ncbi:ABC transporter permease [candidate division TA06 bacterium DG_24]|uniref:ABC transporter permease n=3 Tax=Bacteria division TA06 TaxID=1156500 RepID=A0A0S8JJJ7_UNCT6|nr:MAG: ABC transporter permease [candidate division TA06 bacterium DG_24]KPK71612.1 MAG: ABC transporter permease [candidate division TA06 bacterium SM23_40]KPL09940.1 MAG: ABC transporter permease [candidate division TA06 bacterium SM1_40]